MTRLLAALDATSEFIRGPEIQISCDRTVQYYHNDSLGQPLPLIILGVLRAVVDRAGKPRILILEAPNPSARITRHIFDRQLQILESTITRDETNPTKRITNKELWSQGPGSSNAGSVYVRMSTETRFKIVDLSTKTKSVLDTIAPEIPPKANPVEALDIGSVLVCTVFPFRADIPVAPLAETDGIYARTIGKAKSHDHKGRPQAGQKGGQAKQGLSAKSWPPCLWEVLALVFLFALTHTDFKKDGTLRAINRLNFCLVSLKWAAVIYGQPTLWSDIFVSPNIKLDFVAFALEQSKEAQLRLHFKLLPSTKMPAEWWDSYLRYIIHTIAETSHRLEELEIECINPTAACTVERGISHLDGSNLVRLHLSLKRGITTTDPEESGGFATGTPHLREYMHYTGRVSATS
ncbi:hypothetical protein C8R46DRAFT_1036203 [Mycena filopes]|nr:hypothetical protein C8R46DRAFT_1036203 [Mycena filopes]